MQRSDVLRLAMPRGGRAVPGILLGLLSALCAVALLATSAYLITRAAEQPPILYLSAAMVGVRAFALGRAFFRYTERLASHDAAFRAMPELRVGLYERLVPRSPDGLGSTRRGDLLSRLVSDVDDQQDLPLRVVQPILVSGLTAMASVVLVWILLPAAGLTLLACLVVAAVVGTAVDSAVARGVQRGVAVLRGEHLARLGQYLRSLDTLIAYGAAPAAERRLDEADRALTAAVRRRVAGASIASALTTLLAGAATLLAVLVGVPSLGSGGFDGPALAVVVLVPLAVFEVFGMIPLALGSWRRVSASAQRIAQVVPDEIPAEIPAQQAPTTAAALPEGRGIRLRGVSARWPGAAEPAVSGVDLDVEAGECVLVTGSSGAGKTTLAHVLVRFLEHGGRYEIDGVDVRDLAPDDVRRVIGLCEQSPHLFDDDIRQNLLFAREDSDDAELLAVLDRVGLGAWAAERGGLDARVGERGSLVSGGQAQRIALARAMLADRPVLVLDEPTAGVDADRADALVADLVGAARASGRAVVLISHAPVDPALVDRALHL
ncbi:thiol reductant ABC exporter subunit CydC [Cnuibacter sp. UC19_7]|uniref:thiol reductant ABC exporter subunit CydC n=1 Tax=Cnuibacter sp. UC19_7 TaxID=3350166 RepID=UPI00366E9816